MSKSAPSPSVPVAACPPRKPDPRSIPGGAPRSSSPVARVRFVHALETHRGGETPGGGANAFGAAGREERGPRAVVSGVGPESGAAVTLRAGHARERSCRSPESDRELRIRAFGRDADRDRRDEGAPGVDLSPFRPSPVLVPPSPAVSPSVLADRADVAAIVERIVVAMRVGTAGRGHAARFGFGGRALDEVNVELTLVDGRLCGVLRAPGHRVEAARRVAHAASEALRARGIELDELSVERA
ncbi:MAG: hypothetical protein IT379_14110 [Deltaproteobacteria bacterium]|nr:hypothetical protein [Deltaproteobacteria bacterium]